MKLLYNLLLVLTLFISGSCKKLVDTYRPPSRITTAEVWASDANAAGVFTKLFSDISYQKTLSNGISYIPGLLSDELQLFVPGETSQYYQNNVLPLTNNGSSWAALYNYIYVCNEALEQLPVSMGVSQPVKDRLSGEAHFIRAFCYFYLVNFYGDVPLILTTDYQQNRLATRAATADVYAQIVRDLNEAISLLGDEYISADAMTATTERVRPNKTAAQALLARVYLYTGEYANAELLSSAVMAHPGYQLPTDLNTVFLINSTEAIWQLLPVTPNRNTPDGDNFILLGAPDEPSPTALSSQLAAAFESGDLRRTNWVGEATDGTTTYLYPFKYKVGRNVEEPQPLTEYVMALRLAEQFLIRAEARAQQGKLSGTGSAAEDLDVIRSRAGLDPTTATDQQSLLAAIWHERQVELFTETGHRWFDLKRTGQVNTVMSEVTPVKGGSWDPNKALLPIPQETMQTAPGLKGHQNPGYE